MIESPKDLVWGLIGIVGFAAIANYLGNLVGWNLAWLYAVAVAVDVAILIAYLIRRRQGMSNADGQPGTS